MKLNRYYIVGKVTERNFKTRKIEEAKMIFTELENISDSIYEIRMAIIETDYKQSLARQRVEIYITFILGVLLVGLVL